MMSMATAATCECGCGELAPIAQRSRRSIGHVKGQPLRYIRGHDARKRAEDQRNNVLRELEKYTGDGLCQCGCGLKAPVSKVTNRSRGFVKGQPQRYIKGHARRAERISCAVEECKGETTQTYCVKHATRLKRHGNLIGKRPRDGEVFRFWMYVTVVDDCWIWGGSTAGDTGYGLHWTDEKRLVGAHRFSYELRHGPITEGLVICHTCDNPPCVNPKHLFMGTQADNMQDMLRKKRKVKETPLTGE